MDADDPFVVLLRWTFPAAKIPDHESLFTNEFLADADGTDSVNKREQEEALDGLERALAAARRHHSRLHPKVARAVDRQFFRNSVERTKFAPGSTLAHVGSLGGRAAHLSTVIRSALLSLRGREAAPLYQSSLLRRQPSAIEAGREALQGLKSDTGKGTAIRVRIVEHAIDLWRRYDRSEPKLSSARFLAFLQGLLDLLDYSSSRNWDAKDVIGTYRRERKLVERG